LKNYLQADVSYTNINNLSDLLLKKQLIISLSF